ncbi:uncharacterized protein JN550_009102 [Neoarthrinium moseri]|uniref:uncharacterized protein n=1 Tax=Neoarthrinium moseri TaxID=1658444 RepID=UPI001FDE1DD8|nr:uncharacterized protein JN550_009102 [Neoarthrinium moseri]KAI1864082.1 hypothetical protein JN550_009102 [Neoarthrinium moseri]
MDDPGWSWPAWKFGMKRDDLFTKLHDQYNTFPSSIQDPEAFHHDVYELSNTANTPDELHRLLADRKEQRLRELNDSLESASLEIIANPKLIGTQQWQYALQLFRTKSLDSLVRYFASYLPEDHTWHHFEDNGSTSSMASSISDSVTDSGDSISTNSSKPFFDDDDHDFLTHEPLTIHTSVPASHLPPSPRSMTMCTDTSLTHCSNSSAASPVDVSHPFDAMTPARTLSFSENESDVMAQSMAVSHCHEDNTSQQDDLDTPSTSISDISNLNQHHHSRRTSARDCSGADASPNDDDLVEDSVEESNTPTPRNERPSDSYPFDGAAKPSSTAKSIHRSSSSLYTEVLNDYVRSQRKGRREGSPARSVRRTSPEIGRVQKPSPDPIRIRPMGRRRNE